MKWFPWVLLVGLALWVFVPWATMSVVEIVLTGAVVVLGAFVVTVVGFMVALTKGW